MDSIDLYVKNGIEILSTKHKSFSNADIEYKQQLAKLVLQRVQSDKWCYLTNWMEENAKLEKIIDINSNKTKQLTAMMRFTMGSIAKTWLSTFLKNTNTETTPNKESTYISEPYEMGLSAPGIDFQLFFEKNMNIDAYEEKCKEGTVSLILGAGNQNFLTLIDIFQRVFIFNECVLVKQHPLRIFLYEPYYHILEPLIEENIVFIIDDYGIDFTKKLITNDFINHIHFTGSENTYKSIQETLQNENKSCDITAELGCVTPWVIFPGEYTENEIKNIAIQLVNAKKNNGGSNCITPQVLILPEKWEQKNILHDLILKEIQNQQTVPCYYPNSIENKKNMMNIYKDNSYVISSTNKLEMTSEDDDIVIIDYGLISNEKKEGICLKQEAFSPVLVIATIENNNIEEYVNNVINTLNSKQIYGSLSCSLFCPQDMNNELINKCIYELEYGTIAINIWSLFGYIASTVGGTWGGYYKNSQSGRGRIGNLFNNQYVSKTIIKNKSLDKMQIDFSNIPPTFLLNLLFALTVKPNNSFDVFIEFINFFLNYILGSVLSLFIINNNPV